MNNIRISVYDDHRYKPSKRFIRYIINKGQNQISIHDYRFPINDISEYQRWENRTRLYKIVEIGNSLVEDIIERMSIMSLGKDVIIELTDEYMIVDNHKVSYDQYVNHIELCYGNRSKAILERLGKGRSSL